MSSRQVSATRTIAVAPEQIFDIIADPARHPEFDGSGTLRSAPAGSPQRLGPGSTFGMSMKMGMPYKIQNTVVEFEENRLIAWRHAGGHRWRWQLTPEGEGTTTVTGTFDWSTAKAPLLISLTPMPKRNQVALAKSLERLTSLVTTS